MVDNGAKAHHDREDDGSVYHAVEDAYGEADGQGTEGWAVICLGYQLGLLLL